mmetsp:Transcript_1709/g.3597  ORF Transcript_1709/g.3597 Transcript_1709/m.3597 type:complete len:458 (-) Transcript_1709:815-2188(-)
MMTSECVACFCNGDDVALEQDTDYTVIHPHSSQRCSNSVTPSSTERDSFTSSPSRDPNRFASFLKLQEQGAALPPPIQKEPVVHPSIVMINQVFNKEHGITTKEDILVRSDVYSALQQPNDQNEEYHAYLLGETISRAIYGRIQQATVLKRRPSEVSWTTTEERAAIKIFSWDRVRTLRSRGNATRHAEDPIREVSAMQQISFGIEYHGGGTHVLSLTDVYADDRNMYMILPYCAGGDFFNLVESSESFSEAEARYWFRQILDGLATLQKYGICHRDISLENLLVSDDGLRVMITDFGMAIPVSYGSDKEREEEQNGICCKLRRLITPQGVCGKPVYISPEILKNNAPFDGFAVDLWAAAIILFILLIGGEPWPYPDESIMTYRLIASKECQIKNVLEHWKVKLSSEAIDLLSKMLQADPNRRLSLGEVIEHEWVVNGDVKVPEAIDAQTQWIDMIE